jgi:hypothetical protein
MTLKERFQQWFINDEEDEHYIGMVELVSIEHDKIADEFAIGFADWCKQEYELEDTSFHNKWRDVNGEYRESKELLEIYKKEKGL